MTTLEKSNLKNKTCRFVLNTASKKNDSHFGLLVTPVNKKKVYIAKAVKHLEVQN